MIKTLLIASGVILLGGFCFVMWVCRKAADDADREIGCNYITEEDWEVM